MAVTRCWRRARLHHCRGADARARHRREHRDLHARRRHAAAPAAGSPSRPTRASGRWTQFLSGLPGVRQAQRTSFRASLAVGGTSALNLADRWHQSDLAGRRSSSGNTFDVLGVRPPSAARCCPPTTSPNGPLVAVLGHDYWRTRFGGDPRSLAASIRINGRPVTIVGVAERRLPRHEPVVESGPLSSRRGLIAAPHRVLQRASIR